MLGRFYALKNNDDCQNSGEKNGLLPFASFKLLVVLLLRAQCVPAQTVALQALRLSRPAASLETFVLFHPVLLAQRVVAEPE